MSAENDFKDGGKAFTIGELEVDLQQAFAFYNSNYTDGGLWLLDPSRPTSPLGDAGSPRDCRFCKNREPKVSFRNVAHAIPELLGNKTLFVFYECDACNQAFGNSYEHHLGAWTKPLGTMSRLRGKNGVPTLEVAGRWSIKDSPTGLHFMHDADDPDFILDEDAKTWTLTLSRDDFRPLYVLKAFIRMGLSLMPQDKIGLFSETLRWLLDVSGTESLFYKQGISWQFQPGPPMSSSILATLMFRQADYAEVPFCVFFLAVGSFTFQVAIPSRAKDWYLQGKTIQTPWFPSFDLQQSQKYGVPVRYTVDFSGAETLRGQKMKFGITYEDRFAI